MKTRLSNNREISRQSLVAEIHNNWDQVVAPQSEIQLWDKAMQKAFKDYTVYNWTDEFIYSKCHSYEILTCKILSPRPGSLKAEQRLIRLMEGQKHSVLLKLSVVAPYYIALMLRRTLGPNGEIVESIGPPQTTVQIDLLQRAKEFAEKKGFHELGMEYLSEPIPDVELELASKNKVLIYNCLFEDQDNEACEGGILSLVSDTSSIPNTEIETSLLVPLSTWRETNFSQNLHQSGYNESLSFLQGHRVPYGTLGSIRPENFKPGSLGGILRRAECVDVRSGDVTTSVRRHRLKRLAIEQAQHRIKHLPHGTIYKIVIDARGQAIPLQKLDIVIDRITAKSKGELLKFNILAMR